MGTKVGIPKTYDSKTIALLAIFLAMVFALEVYPIIGITDIPIPGINFTLDWTGIPLVLLFLFFGPVFAFLGVGFMGIVIGYRNIVGATFKVFAEFYKILGILMVWLLIRNRDISYARRVILYAISAAVFCSIGMFLTNIPLLQFLYGLSIEAAITASIVLVPWNILQSVVNVLAGMFLYQLIPDDLKLSFLLDARNTNSDLLLDEE
ncbi:MAG: hypothetical protein ACFFEJ_14445 [Candidatus Thorarchaeota archaeon]